MDRKSLIIKLAIIIIIIIIAMIIGIIVLLRNEDENVEIQDISNDVFEPGEEGEEGDDVFGYFGKGDDENNVDDEAYFLLKYCIETYFNITNIKSGIYDGIENTDNVIKEEIYKLLSSSYINKNNITKENVLEFIEEKEEQTIFVPLEMKLANDGDIKNFLIHGYLENLDLEVVDEVYLIINIDLMNETFSVQPIYDKYDDIREIKINDFETSIDMNDSNIYRMTGGAIQDIALEYMDIFKKLTLGAPEKMYTYFDKDYAEKRFGGVENFIKYVEENKEEILGLQCTKYMLNNNGVYTNKEYSEYVLQDQYENYYVFDTESFLNYDIKLDTYTLPTNEFTEAYSSATNQKKVQMNVDKFIQIINRHDFRTSFGYLASSFVSQNNLTEDSFKEIVKKKFFSHNNLEFVQFDDLGSNTYAFKIKLTDKTGTSDEERIMTIIMRLNDGENFELSFDIE